MRIRFPRLYAAASLKQACALLAGDPPEWFSAALCRGLIEAQEQRKVFVRQDRVFRGFMPRPH